MTATQSIELFDKFGHFIMPTAEQIASLDTDTQARFAAVQEAATELQTATANRVAAEQGVTDAVAERAESERALRVLRPKVSAVQAAKEFIASERAQR